MYNLDGASREFFCRRFTGPNFLPMSPVAKVGNLDIAESLTNCQNFECQTFKISGNRAKSSLERMCSVIVVRGSMEASASMMVVVVSVFITMNSFLSEVF